MYRAMIVASGCVCFTTDIHVQLINFELLHNGNVHSLSLSLSLSPITLLRQLLLLEMDNSGSLLAEAYSGLNGRLVIHRFSDIRNRVEAIRQYEIDKENEGDGIVNCGNNIDNDDDTNYTSEEERCRKRQRTYKVQLRGCYASQYEEALGLNTGRDLTSCTWCPADQDIVACCSASVRILLALKSIVCVCVCVCCSST